MNTAFLSTPVATEADLQDRISVAKEYFGQKKTLWLFVAFDEWLDSLIQPERLFRQNGLCHMQSCVGMQTKNLVVRTSPVPELLFRPVTNDVERLAFSSINSDSYAFSAAWRSDIARWSSQWPALKVRSYVGYSRNEAVTSAMVHLTGDVGFLGFVATKQGHQRNGFAEAIVRHALAAAESEWHVSKSILHSTPAGLPLYRSLGYSEVTSFSIYLGGCE